MIFDLLGRVLQVGWADRFVGVLGAFFGAVMSSFWRQVFFTVGLCYKLAGGADRFWSQAHRVGTHICDQAFGSGVAKFDAFVEALSDVHRARGGEAVMAGGFLLEGRGDKGRDGVAL